MLVPCCLEFPNTDRMLMRSSLANRRDELDKETRNMAALLSKFRIDYSDVIIIPDILKKAETATKAEFNALISDLPNGTIPATQLEAEKEKTNRSNTAMFC